ncbi:hypothetical protein [Kitasatospora sp. NPDC088351]|uniref:hypothetical protein n=1 Tax=Kitasatospora sp. NPDC088351 TaxID=3155180 RepID=UPI0034300FC0
MTTTPMADSAFRDSITELIDTGKHAAASSVFGDTPGLCLVRMSTLVRLAGHQRAMRRVVLNVTQRLEAIPHVRHFPEQLPNDGGQLVCLYRTDSMTGRLIEAVLAAPKGVDGGIAAALGYLGAFTRGWESGLIPNKHAS